MAAGRPPCACGHSAEVHEHYRRGSDCGACGRSVCPRYVRGGNVLELDGPVVDLPLPREPEPDDARHQLRDGKR